MKQQHEMEIQEQQQMQEKQQMPQHQEREMKQQLEMEIQEQQQIQENQQMSQNQERGMKQLQKMEYQERETQQQKIQEQQLQASMLKEHDVNVISHEVNELGEPGCNESMLTNNCMKRDSFNLFQEPVPTNSVWPELLTNSSSTQTKLSSSLSWSSLTSPSLALVGA